MSSHAEGGAREMIVSVYENGDELASEVPLTDALATVAREVDRREGETDFDFHLEIEVRG